MENMFKDEEKWVQFDSDHMDGSLSEKMERLMAIRATILMYNLIIHSVMDELTGSKNADE